ncbi:MAG: hypothetical protein FWG08_03450 [Propionibacteriaceae bacterium]|nr:hypothetical protein [Propionibacteriaceae bacterium]
MKRRDLEKKIREIAKTRGLPAIYTEGGKHTTVSIGKDITSIPRHREIDKDLAKDILRILQGN